MRHHLVPAFISFADFISLTHASLISSQIAAAKRAEEQAAKKAEKPAKVDTKAEEAKVSSC
jgi:hypothetical protein